MNRDRYIILFLLTIITGLSLWIIHLREIQQRFFSKFFEYEFEPVRNVMTTKWKETQKVYDYAFDRNNDHTDDSLIVLGKNGQTSAIWVDEDYNGYYEVQYIYDRNGRCIVRYEDLGQDGSVEELISFGADSTRTYIDRNENGLYEQHEILSTRPTE